MYRAPHSEGKSANMGFMTPQMGQYSSPDSVRGVNGPFLLTPAADTERKRLATWARDVAQLSIDYDVNGQGDRIYRFTSLEPFVKPLLQEMKLVVGHQSHIGGPC